jgi:hypothetical protein
MDVFVVWVVVFADWMSVDRVRVPGKSPTAVDVAVVRSPPCRRYPTPPSATISSAPGHESNGCSGSSSTATEGARAATSGSANRRSRPSGPPSSSTSTRSQPSCGPTRHSTSRPKISDPKNRPPGDIRGQTRLPLFPCSPQKATPPQQASTVVLAVDFPFQGGDHRLQLTKDLRRNVVLDPDILDNNTLHLRGCRTERFVVGERGNALVALRRQSNAHEGSARQRWHLQPERRVVSDDGVKAQSLGRKSSPHLWHGQKRPFVGGDLYAWSGAVDRRLACDGVLGAAGTTTTRRCPHKHRLRSRNRRAFASWEDSTEGCRSSRKTRHSGSAHALG